MRRLTLRFTLAHLVMVVAGLVTFVSVTAVLRERHETQEVAVARAEVPAGTALDASTLGDHFEVVAVRADSPMLGGVANPDVMGSGQLARTLTVGEPLLSSDLVPIDSGAGERTFTVGVDDVTLVGLGLQVGDRVDIIGSFSDGTFGYVVANVRVARLPVVDTTGGAFSVRQESFVTVEVGEDDALRLASARQAGDIEIVRSTGAPELADG